MPDNCLTRDVSGLRRLVPDPAEVIIQAASGKLSGNQKTEGLIEAGAMVDTPHRLSHKQALGSMVDVGATSPLWGSTYANASLRSGPLSDRPQSNRRRGPASSSSAEKTNLLNPADVQASPGHRLLPFRLQAL